MASHFDCLAMQNSQSCIVFPPFSAVRDIRFVASDAAMRCLTVSCGKRRRIVCTPPPSPLCAYRRFSCAVKVHNLAVASNSAVLSALSFVRRVFHIVLVQAVWRNAAMGQNEKTRHVCAGWSVSVICLAAGGVSVNVYRVALYRDNAFLHAVDGIDGSCHALGAGCDEAHPAPQQLCVAEDDGHVERPPYLFHNVL